MHDLCIFWFFCSKIIFDQKSFSYSWDKFDYQGPIVYLPCYFTYLWGKERPGNLANLQELGTTISPRLNGFCQSHLTHELRVLHSLPKISDALDFGQNCVHLNFFVRDLKAYIIFRDLNAIQKYFQDLFQLFCIKVFHFQLIFY